MSTITDDFSFLTEIYDLNNHKHEIVKEYMRVRHAYQTIGDPDILTEGVADILGKMADFFKKVIDKLKEFFKKILMFIDGQFMEIDKFVKKYKKELDEIDKVVLKIDGFEFTLNKKPDLTPFKELVDTYNSSIVSLKDMTKEALTKEMNEMLSDRNLDKVRGTVLGAESPLGEDDFREEVRKFYRNGEESTQSIDIDTSMYKNIVDNVGPLVEEKKKAVKLRDAVLLMLDKTEKFFGAKVRVIYKGGERVVSTNKLEHDAENNKITRGEEVVSKESEFDKIDRFIRYKYTYCSKVSNIVNTVVTEYANAYKDEVKQCRTVILKGLSNPTADEVEESKEDSDD